LKLGHNNQLSIKVRINIIQNMKRALFLFSLFSSIFAEDFITEAEYAKLLYENPRGVGCSSCHGSKGEGKVLATYIEKGIKKNLEAPPINNLSYEMFKEGISKPSKIMPSYFLTNFESQSLYRYISSFKKSQ